MRKKISLFGIILAVFFVGALGGIVADYIIFSKLITHPTWSQNPIIEAIDNRVKIIKTTEKVIVQDNESIADIASRAVSTTVFVESISEEDGIVSSGNGVVLSGDGIIATTNAIVTNAEAKTYVKTIDNVVYTAEVAYEDVYSGIVFLKIDAEDLSTIPFADSDEAQSGKRLIGITQSRIDNGVHLVSGGLIGHIRDFSVASPASDHLQGVLRIDFSDHAFFESQGAPIIDYRGNMLGLVASKSDVQTGERESYALASNDVSAAFEAYLRSNSTEKSDVERIFGIDYEMLSSVDMKRDSLDLNSGARISSPVSFQERTLFTSSLFGRSGVRGGDIVITVNNDVVDVKNNLSRLLHKYQDDPIVLKVLRGDDLITVELLEK